MDSATQFVLGACVSAAVLGPRIGPRKAAVLGGLMGTVPDLDVYYPYADAVDSFTLHRGPTHSLVVQALATPIFGEAILRLFRRFREDGAAAHRWAVYAAVYLTFATHALLDAMTVYGTKLFWPVSTEPIGIGSVFIIDPLYTLPLLVLTLWALFQGRWGPRFRRGLATVLIVSTGYLGWSLGAQQWALAKAEAALGGWQTGDVALATPAPFSTLFWKVIVLRDDAYANVYVPLLGGPGEVRAYAHPRNASALGCAATVENMAQVADFSDDFVRFERDGDALRIADLRMGLTPGYVFRFELARLDGSVAVATDPLRVQPTRDIEKDLAWLIAGISGTGLVRPDEAGARLAIPETESFLQQPSKVC